MVPTKHVKKPKPLIFAKANLWDALPMEVQVDIGNWDKKVGETTESPVGGQD